MKTSSKGLLAGIAALGMLGGGLRADDSVGRLEGQISRFWGIAEERVQAKPVSPAERQPLDCEVRLHKPCPRQEPSCRDCRPRCSRPVVVRPERPSVDIEQSESRRDRTGSWGLNVLGGLNLFNVTWGERDRQDRDSLRGRL